MTANIIPNQKVWEREVVEPGRYYMRYTTDDNIPANISGPFQVVEIASTGTFVFSTIPDVWLLANAADRLWKKAD